MNNQKMIITLPNSDVATNYLSVFSKEIISFAEKQGIFPRILSGQEANKELFQKSLEKTDPKMIVFNGHGSDNCITGQKEVPLVELNVNHALLLNRIIYARSCYAAKGLGAALASENQGCFIGYILPFMFLSDINWTTNPSKDKIASVFLETSNIVPLGILKGNTAFEASRNCKIKILKIIKKCLLKQDKDSEFIAETLWNNYEAQVVLGNKQAKLKD